MTNDDRPRARRNPEDERALDEIIARARRRPRLDPRSDDELLGYHEHGTFE